MQNSKLLLIGAAALILALLSPFAAWFVFYIFGAGVHDYGKPAEPFGFPSELNALGDSFGLANVLVSGFAFIALIITIQQQRESLEQQRKDVRINQEHLQQSIKEMSQTAESTKELAQSQVMANQLAAFERCTDLVDRIDRSSNQMPNATHLAIPFFQEQLALLKDCRRMRIVSGRSLPCDVETQSRKIEVHFGEFIYHWSVIANTFADNGPVNPKDWTDLLECQKRIYEAILDGSGIERKEINHDAPEGGCHKTALDCRHLLLAICKLGQLPFGVKERKRDSNRSL
ncbi:MAG: hypothetical protein KDB00_15375 [Planctomycetales bacterium]|nr:hypothetical protein [Planctomycetales bacterium]